MYSYVASSLKATAVQQAITCNFTSETEKNLILAKGNCLEIRSFRGGSLELDLEATLFGKISCLNCYRPNNLNQDVIFVLTDRKHFTILGYDATVPKLTTRATGNLRDRVSRENESGLRTIVDPDNRVIAMALCEGILKILPIEGQLKEVFPVRMPDVIRFVDFVFLHGCPKPTICVLSDEGNGVCNLRTHTVDMREKELVPGPFKQDNVNFGAKLLIAVPGPFNGVVIVGEGTVSYINNNCPTQTIVIPPVDICSQCRLAEDGSRFLLGDTRGNIHVLVLLNDGKNVTGLAVDLVGSSTIPESMSSLGDGLVFIGSMYGDSQLVRLPSSPSGNSEKMEAESDGRLEALTTFANVGPILDMCVVEAERQGQSQLVTCSGAYQDGSLRVIRCGVGIEEQASIELSGLRGIWSLAAPAATSATASFDKYLVQAFNVETRVLSIDNSEMEEAEIPGFRSDETTLYCGNATGSQLVQVTPSGVYMSRLLTESAEPPVAAFAAARSVTVAAGDGAQLVLAMTGGELVCLEVDPEVGALRPVATVALDQDVACMSVASEGARSDAMAVSSALSAPAPGGIPLTALVAVGMWTDNSVRLLVLPSLEEVARVALGTETQARNVLLVKLEGTPYLLVGLGDGVLISYVLDLSAGLPVLASRKKIVLGSKPIAFTPFVSSSGSLCVFAACDRPTILYTRGAGKILYSVVNVGEVTSMAPFHSEQFPHCLAMISEAGLAIGTVDAIQKVHVSSYPLGESPRRIAHHAPSGSLIVLTEKTTTTERGDESFNRVLFFEDGTMKMFHAFNLEFLEQALSVCVCQLEMQAATSSSSSSSSAGPAQDYVVVGTAFVKMHEVEPSEGRLLVFALNANAEGTVSAVLVGERSTKGAVFSIAPLPGRFAATVASKVQVFSATERGGSGSSAMSVGEWGDLSSAFLTLRPECTHAGQIMPLYLKSHADFVLVGDLMRSMTLLQYKPSESVLEEVCRDFNCNYMRGVEVVGEGDDVFIGADDSGNIFSLRRLADATTDEERGKFEAQAEMGLGDHINVFRRGSLTSQPSEAADVSHAQLMGLTSTAFGGAARGSNFSATGSNQSILFGTICGSIGTILSLSEEAFTFFHTLERAVKNTLIGVGSLSHDDYRMFLNDRRSNPHRNTVDGDLVERFLDMVRQDQDAVVRQLNDDLSAAAQHPPTGASTGSCSSSSAVVSILAMPEPKELTVEDCIRRVEEIARLH